MAKSFKQKIYILLIIILIGCKEDKNIKGYKNSNSPVLYRNDKIIYNKDFKDSIETGWYQFIKNGNKIKSQLIIRDNEPFVNQVIIYNKNNEIDSAKSKFFTIDLPDTLNVGPNIGKAHLYTYNKSSEARASRIIINNTYPDGSMKKDTFGGNPKNIEFGIYALKKGKIFVKGKILETVLVKENKNKFSEIQIKSYFKKEVYVKE